MNQKPNDPLHRLKHFGYCAAFGSTDRLTLRQFITYAKTYLCIQNKVLFKDPIWDTYGDEEILVEYFAHLYTKDADARAKFEGQIKKTPSEYDDFLQFADKSITENAKELEDRANEMKDSISFKPDTLGD